MKKRPYLSWNVAEIAEYRFKDIRANKNEFPWAVELTDDQLYDNIYGDSDYFDAEFEWLTEALTEKMAEMNKGEYWLASVENFGWRHLSGGKNFKASTGGELLNAVLPRTECSFKIYVTKKGITINNAHHDAPTGGEMYYIRPLTSAQWDKIEGY